MPDFDDWIDAQLRNVSVPRDLHARLRSHGPAAGQGAGGPDGSSSAPLDDERLDALLRNVRVPAHLERRLRAIPHRYWPAAGMWAAAASILILLGGSGYWLLSGRAADGQRQVANHTARPDAARPTAQALAQAPAKRSAKTSGPSQRQTPITVRLGQDSQDPQQADSQGVLDNVANVGNSLRQAIEARLRAQSALGSGGQFQRLPPLDVLDPPVARGISPPRVRGYDLLFQLKHGEHPWVMPAAGGALRVSRVPFTFRTSSYDQAVASIAHGRLPEPHEIRVEDFLAAQRYVLPAAPPAHVVLHAAGCPSPLGTPGPQLLQFVIQAGSAPQPKHAATQLVAVIDTSSAMQVGARSKTVRRALGKLAAQMDANDRLTVIGFAESPRVIAESATRADILALVAAGLFDDLGGSADIQSAIRAAHETAEALPAQQTRRVLFVTASDGALDAPQARDAQETFQQLAAAGVAWQVVRLSTGGDAAAWSKLARASGGKATTANSADELATAAIELLTGHSSTVASRTSLKIDFNPKAITSYRMLGHEAVTLTGDAGDPLLVDLHAGQTATCMYEVWLKPGGEGDLASAELVWHDPKSRQQRRQVVPIRPSQLVATFAAAPPWLQQGVVAARTAEFLRGSYFLPNSRRLGQLLELADEADVSVFRSSEYRELLQAIEQAARLR